MQTQIDQEYKIKLNSNVKHYFAGITLGASTLAETGVVVIDSDLNLIKIDKIYEVKDLDSYIETNLSTQDSIICVNIPKSDAPIQSKWRYEIKKITSLKDHKNHDWTERATTRGSDICSKFKEKGYDLFRYCVNTEKIKLNINSPYKDRSPQSVKYMQMTLENSLGVKGFTNNLLPLSAIDSIIGAYLAKQIFLKNYTQLGSYQNIPILSTKNL
ncbi:MAG: hypothetical protein PHV68_09790 [Candidatus Gastranaerophilales bacterium]|nr:hypothetical protein [Candidatus Gastranaerophilales bacterium]